MQCSDCITTQLTLLACKGSQFATIQQPCCSLILNFELVSRNKTATGSSAIG